MTQGERLKKIRQNLNLSQEDFGKIFEIQKQMVSSLENNKIKLNNEKLEKLLITYNVNINWLLAEIGDMFIKKQPDNLKEEIKQAVREMIQNNELFKDEFK